MTSTLLGNFRSLEPVWRLAGGAALLAALALVTVLQDWRALLKREESSLWWASNGRDVLNVLAAAMVTFALALMGFPPASALLLAVTVILVLHLVENAAGTRRGALWIQMLVALALATPLLLAPDTVHALLSRLADGLFASVEGVQ